jgi:site-specific DNA recombinase
MGAARRKGRWVGGRPPFGYDVAPGGRKLVINQGEAEQVREMFAMYQKEQSLLRVPSRAGRDESSRDRRDEMKWRCESGRPG